MATTTKRGCRHKWSIWSNAYEKDKRGRALKVRICRKCRLKELTNKKVENPKKDPVEIVGLTGASFPARYASTCTECDKKISKGDEIYWVFPGARHQSCPK